jgi:hypothetical protein
MTYGTTVLFLEYFGLRNLDELPAAEELRRIPVTRPEALETAEPGLATVAPDQLAVADVESLTRPGTVAPEAEEPKESQSGNEHPGPSQSNR